MARPKAGYALADGTKVPGTTTVIGRFKESGALIGWAYKQGKAGVPLYDSRDKAADIGTAAHAMVEAHINNQPFDRAAFPLPNDDWPKAESAFNAYLRWTEQTKLVVVECEVSLVSEKYKFGGTLDFVGMIGNQLVLGDVKTSGAIYTDHIIQVAAYKHLWDEHHPESPITGGCRILRFAKEHADFAEHSFHDVSEAWRQFVLFREAFEIDRILKKRAA